MRIDPTHMQQLLSSLLRTADAETVNALIAYALLTVCAFSNSSLLAYVALACVFVAWSSLYLKGLDRLRVALAGWMAP